MREWLSAQEIADEALPGMPATKKGVLNYGERFAWDLNPALARPRAGRGGGMEYHFRLLPLLAQVAYAERHMAVGAPVLRGSGVAGAPQDEGVGASQSFEARQGRAPQDEGGRKSLTDRAAIERDARLAIVSAYQAFGRGLQLGETAKLQIFTDKFNAGKIAVDDWVRQAVPSVSKRSLLRWKSARKEGKTERLAFDRAASRRGTGVIDTANGGRLKAWILALLADAPHLHAPDIRDLCEKEFGATVTVVSKGVETTIPLPPLRTFQEGVKALKKEHKAALLKMTNPDRYRSTMAPAGIGALSYVSHPNQLWQIDASPMDALCTDGRHVVYCCIDIATRRTVWQLSKTATAAAVGLLIRKAILAWGVPEAIKMDNGSDFVAQATLRLFASLGIDPSFSTAYSPEQKGHVERAIKTMQHGFAVLLPGYVGHSVADRKAIESRKAFSKRSGESEAETFQVALSATEMQGKLDQWAAQVYANKPHAGLQMRTPFQVAAASTRPIRTVDARALDVLLLPPPDGNPLRVVGKQGIRIDHRHYRVHTVLAGTTVMVRCDPNDLGRVLVFHGETGAFLEEAVCPEFLGVGAADQQRLTKELLNEMTREAVEPIRRDVMELRKRGPLIDQKLALAEQKHGNVVALPKRSETHSTPQIAAALDAMADRSREADTGISAEAAAEQARMIDEMSGAEIAEIYERSEKVFAENIAKIAERERVAVPEGVAKLPESPKQRYRRAMKMREAQERGEIDGDFYDGLWLARYEQSAEFRAQAAMHEDFGDAYLAP